MSAVSSSLLQSTVSRVVLTIFLPHDSNHIPSRQLIHLGLDLPPFPSSPPWVVLACPLLPIRLPLAVALFNSYLPTPGRGPVFMSQPRLSPTSRLWALKTEDPVSPPAVQSLVLPSSPPHPSRKDQKLCPARSRFFAIAGEGNCRRTRMRHRGSSSR